MKKALVLSYPLSTQRRLCSDWADIQADLSLRWAHNHFVGFDMLRHKLVYNACQRQSQTPAMIDAQKGSRTTLFVACKISQNMTKPSKWPMHPAKAQISLGICPVWSAFSLRALRIGKDQRCLHARSKLRPWSALSLCWAHQPICWFCHAVAQFNSYFSKLHKISSCKPKVKNIMLKDSFLFCSFFSIFYRNVPKFSDRHVWANSADPDQTAPRGAVWSGSTLFAISSSSFGCITLRKCHLVQLLGWLQ